MTPHPSSPRAASWMHSACATLIEHRDRWGREPAPTAARLERLAVSEAELYADLVSGALGEAVRLEQERIDWAWVEDRLPYD